MAGVAGPMLKRSRPQGIRFLFGLLIGGAVASTLLAGLLFGVGTVTQWLIPRHGLLVLAAAVLLLLGAADLADRTPHVWRQVPQRYVRLLPPGRLGTVWGFDLALLFTTQKSTSLPWAALAGTALLAPSSSWLVLIGMTVIGIVAVTVRSVVFSIAGPSLRSDRGRPWHTHVRRAAGAALLVLAVAVTAWSW
jgi:hypothetical protein